VYIKVVRFVHVPVAWRVVSDPSLLTSILEMFQTGELTSDPEIATPM
jgi:hypothetical protein